MAADDGDSLLWDGNAKANFALFTPGGTDNLRNNADADGYAVINFVKGKKAYNVSGEVWNMQAGDYTLSLGTAGVLGGNLVLLQFVVGADGYAAFSAKHVTGDGTNDLAPAESYNIARIYRGACCNTELTAPLPGLSPTTTPGWETGVYVNAFGDAGYLDFRNGKRFDE